MHLTPTSSWTAATAETVRRRSYKNAVGHSRRVGEVVRAVTAYSYGFDFDLSGHVPTLWDTLMLGQLLPGDVQPPPLSPSQAIALSA